MLIDRNRLRDDLETNATFGEISGTNGTGRTVLPGSDAMRQARDYLITRMEAAGLDVRVDAIGNIAGRWTPATASPDAAPVATGSHLDSVPEGGIFDGPLGVYAGLEAVRTLQRADIDVQRPIEIVSFTGEEGSRFPPLVGSSVAAGNQSAAEALELTDDDGITLADALANFERLGDWVLDASKWDSWVELHIEQASKLERADVPMGIVSAITGIMQLTVHFEGEADHAGTTPMSERTDASIAAAEFVLDVERATTATGTGSESLVGTVGKHTVEPNATNVVPGTVEVGVDIRDVKREPMEELKDAAIDSLHRIASERGVETKYELIIDIESTQMTDRCICTLRDAAATENIDRIDLHSGAGHDTMQIASATDVGMIFAPSKDGRSHSPMEWTDWGDCADATQVLTRGIAALSS